MAQLSNTFESYDNSATNREEIDDTIANITPHETPFMSLVKSKKVKTLNPSWPIDSNASPDNSNNQPEGNEWTYESITAPTLVNNYCQISDKKVTVTKSLEKTDKAGRDSEIAYQVAKKGVELRTDQEVIVLSNQASSAGSADAATNRKLGGLRAFLTTNTDLGSGGSDGGLSGGLITAATNGTQRAFTKAILDANILSAYTAGANIDGFFCMMSPYVKQVFSTFMDDANVVPLRQAAKATKGNVVIAAVDAYLSDFGLINMVPNRQMSREGASTARNVFFIDPSKVGVGKFRPMEKVTPAVTGDSIKRVLVTEYTLCVDNEACHAVAADIYGISASS
ncbi:MAG: DUF5309 domain-containing protein [Chloroflexi bacterium]|nr:DUF5309 domain-containing protein [Chloroflexota bacterium]